MTVTDFNGNVVDWKGTESEALQAGYNVNCSGCSGCSRCSGCSDCSGCFDCSRCSGCSGCSSCSSCFRCSSCSSCFRCSRCSGCSDCSGCFDCSRCSGCSGCYGCSEQPICIATGDWSICIRKDKTMKIGCQDHPVDFWMAACDEVISAMHPKALKFWAKWKPVIERIVSCGN